MMEISKLINQLPPLSDKDKTIEDALVSYGSWLVNDEPKKLLTSTDIEEINEMVRKIIKANSLFLIGQLVECYKLIHDIIFSNSLKYQSFKTYQVEAGKMFFRIRESKNDYLFSKEEMFHIPFQERQKTSNQRFSLTGYPSLYLGKTIYVCWEELNRPKFDIANIVGLKTIRPLNLLDLRMPTEIDDVSDYYRIPLIIASSVRVKEPHLPFKPEYTISQAILHAIIHQNNTVKSKDNLNGIIYYSTFCNDRNCLFRDLELFENIIVPTVNNINDMSVEKIFQDGFCPVLCNTFEITTPISFNVYQLSQDVKTSIPYVYSSDKKQELYTFTQMGVLEDFIKKMETQTISPNKFLQNRPDLLEKY